MIKYFNTVSNERGDVLANYRVQVVDSLGASVDIFADAGGTRFTDSGGNIVNYTEAQANGRVAFYWTPADGQVLQTLDASGNLVDAESDFANAFVLANLPGNIGQDAVTGLVADLATKAATADLASTEAGKGAELIGNAAPIAPSAAGLAAADTARNARILDGAIWIPADAANYAAEIDNDPGKNNVIPSTFDPAKIHLRKSFLDRDYVMPEDFAASGDSYDYNSILRALTDGRQVRLKPRVYATGQRITAPRSSLFIQGEGADSVIEIAYQPGTTTGERIIALLVAGASGTIIVKNMLFECNGGGQLDAGAAITLNGVTPMFFDIDGVLAFNGGTPYEHASMGCNAIAVATTAYPSGPKSRGFIRNCYCKGFTKAPFNVTTYAEEVWLRDNISESNFGNNFTPGIQINGGRKVNVIGNRVKGTEGSGIIIGTVGTVPPYPPTDIFIDQNHVEDVGTLGEGTTEKFGYFVTDGNSSPSGSATQFNVTFGTNTYRNVAGPAVRISTFGGSVVADKFVGIGSQLGLSIANSSNINIGELHLTNVNIGNLTSQHATSFVGANNVYIGLLKYTNKAGETAPNLCDFQSTASTNIKIHAEWEGAIASYPVTQSTAGMVRNSRITWEHDYTVAAAGNAVSLITTIADGVTATLRSRATAASLTESGNQEVVSTVRTTGAAAAILNNTSPVNYKSAGLATGVDVGVTGPAIRQRLFAAAAEETKFSVRSELVIM